MTKLEALKALAKRIEAGVDIHRASTFVKSFEPLLGYDAAINVAAWARTAHNKASLDAAKSLHEAVLPDWHSWQVLMRSSWVDVVLTGPRTGYRGYQNLAATVRRDDKITCPARAWLLAIIRALIAQEESA